MQPLANDWRDNAPGILVARLPADRPSWEPIIVTTLRRYVRRGASDSLLLRIAGGRRHFDTLNRVWDLDGRALERVTLLLPDVAKDPAAGIGLELGFDERRIALLQIIADYDRVGAVMPSAKRLGRYFGCHQNTIEHDLDVLEGQGAIQIERVPAGVSTGRRIRPVERRSEAA